MSLSISLLGSFQVILNDEPAAFATDSARALLAFLAVEAERPHRRETLAGLLWPEQSEQPARSNLSQTLVRLRRAIGDYQAQPPPLLITAKTIQFRVASADLDLLRFQSLLAASASHPHSDLGSCPVCLERLQQAVNLYRGPFLQGLFLANNQPFEEWRLFKQEQFHRQAMQALHNLASSYELQGLYEPAQDYAKRQLALEPWREEAHRQLMRALVLSGQRNAALAQYEICRRVLAKELAVEPAVETTALHEQIRTGKFGKDEGGGMKDESRTSSSFVPLRDPSSFDWGEAPSVTAFYGREAELAQLEQWLVADRCRLVAILGLGGIGKTVLAVRIAKQVSLQFDSVIWRSLLNAPPLITLLPVWLRFLSNQQLERLPDHLDEQLQLLFDYLRRQRCLLILDNVETVMQQGNRAGQYRPGYEVYDQLIRRFGESEHQSCLLLTSRERPHGLARLADDTASIRFLHLGGLAEAAGEALLQGQGLSSPAKTLEGLVEHYSGHPLALKLIAQTIQQLFGGDTDGFLKQETVIFDDIRDVLDQQFARLSALEQDIMFWLAIEREAVSPQVLRNNLVKSESGGAFLEALRSLQRRSLLEPVPAGFTLQNVIMEYTTGRLIDQVYHEIIRGDVSVFQSHALIKAQAREYVRQSQARLILESVARRLVAKLGQPGVEARLRGLLDRMQTEAPRAPGYTAGNVLNLLLHLDCDLRGYDFSRLCLWQVYLRGTSLPEVNFTQADLTGSVFSDTFASVHAIAFSPDDRLLAAGTGSGPIYLWQAEDGPLTGTLIGHTSFVWSIAFSPDSRLLASASEDRTVRIWDVQTRQLLHILPGADGWGWAVAFSPDGAILATSQGDQMIRLWRLGSNPTREAFTMQLHQTLRGHSSWARALTFSPDGTMLVSGSDDQTLRLWDLRDTGHCARILSGHTGWIRSVAFSPDGRTIASGSDDRTVRLWAVSTGQVIQTLSEHSAEVFSVAFSPDGTTLASGGKDLTIRLWNMRDTRQPVAILSGHILDVGCLAFSSDGATLVSGSWDQTVRLWEVWTGRIRTVLRGYTNCAQALVFYPEGRLLAASNVGQTVRLWDVHSGHTCQSLRGDINRIAGIAGIAFSPNGAIVATAGWGTVRLWDVQSGRVIQVMSGHTGAVTNLAFSLDGARVASGSNDRTIRVWSVKAGQVNQILSGHGEEVRAIAFSSDGLKLVSVGADHTVRVWDLRDSGQLCQTWRGHTNIVSAVAFSPKEELIASGSYDWTIRVWEVSTGQVRHILRGHTSTVNVLSFNPEGAILASGSDDQTVRIWDVPNGQLCHVLQGHTGWVRSLAFSPDGATLASSSDDETVKLWDVESGICLGTFEAEGPYFGLNITNTTGLTEAQKVSLKTLGAFEEGMTRVVAE